MSLIRIAAATACFISLNAMGQVGLRLAYLHYEPMAVGCNFHLLGGLDIDVSRRSAVGLDIGISVDLAGAAEDNYELLIYKGYEVYVAPITHSWVLSFRSLYFLSDNDHGAYLASNLGYRSVRLQLDPYVTNDLGMTDPSWARRSEQKMSVIQLGLRLGTRSELDGFYGDLYVGAGFNLGAQARNSELPDYMSTSDWGIRSIYFMVGLASGIGW